MVHWYSSPNYKSRLLKVTGKNEYCKILKYQIEFYASGVILSYQLA